MRAIKKIHAAACAGGLALIVTAGPYSFGQQQDATTGATTQQRGPTVDDLQKQIDELQRQINLLKKGGADSPEALGVKTGKTSTPVPSPVLSPSPAPVAASAAVSGTVAANPGSETAGSKNPHSEPFAFADFTWL